MKFRLIEKNMPRGIHTICLMIKIEISFRISRISSENAFFSPRLKLVIIVGYEIGIACTIKNF